MLKTLKLLQVATAVAVLIQMWMMYPGVMVVFASFAGLAYLLSTVAAAYDVRFFIWVSAPITLAVCVWTSYFVVLATRYGFSYWSGVYVRGDEIDFFPYVILFNALLSASVVVLHLMSWRWYLFGAGDRQKNSK